MSQLISENNPVARKDHRCELCGGIIHKGERYSCNTYKDDEVYRFKCHIHCNELTQQVYKAGYADMYEGVTCDNFECYILDVQRETHTLPDGTIDPAWKKSIPELAEMLYHETCIDHTVE